ncbi:MAG: hypothetical protein ACM30G_23175 [Micromonosporaceae bacterium]
MAKVTIADLEALLASLKAEQADAEKLNPTEEFVAELFDHKVDPRKLADFIARVVRALDRLGVDIHAEGGEDETQPEGDVVADAIAAPAVVPPVGPTGETKE